MLDIHNIITEYFKNKDNPIILDVGTYLMEDATIFAHEYLNSQVFAFECDPRNVQQIHMRQGYPQNVKLINTAISDHDGTTTFWQSSKINFDTPYLLSGSIKKPTGHLEEYTVSFGSFPIKIPCQKLDTWYKNSEINNQNIEFIWCDVNGGEKEFLDGAIETLKKTHLLWIECFEKELYEGQVDCYYVTNFLEKLGFKYLLTHGHNKLYEQN